MNRSCHAQYAGVSSYAVPLCLYIHVLLVTPADNAVHAEYRLGSACVL